MVLPTPKQNSIKLAAMSSCSSTTIIFTSSSSSSSSGSGCSSSTSNSTYSIQHGHCFSSLFFTIVLPMSG